MARTIARHAALLLVAAGLTLAGATELAAPAVAGGDRDPAAPRTHAAAPLGAHRLAAVRGRQHQLVADHRATPTFAKSASTTFTVNTTEDSGLADAGGTTCVDAATGKCSLRAAVQAANNRDTAVRVVLAAKTYVLTTGTHLVVDDPAGISVVGKGATKTTIQGAGSRLFYVEGTTGPPLLFLTGLTLTGGTADRGGAIYAGYANTGSTLVFDGVVVTGNTATSGGGGLYVDDWGTVYARSTKFTGNTASYGGGVFTYWADVNLVKTTITGNEVVGNGASGGGLYTEYGVLRMTGGSISNNTAGTPGVPGAGGGWYDRYGNVVLTGVHIDGNTADGGGLGAGAYLDYDVVDINRGTISRNDALGAGSDGGGIYTDSGVTLGLHGVTMKADSVASPSATAVGGGAIYSYGNYYGNQIVIDSHTAITGANGSAIYADLSDGHLDLAVADSTLSGNDDESQNGIPGTGCGGAICANVHANGAFHLTMTGSKVTANSSVGAGGGGAVSVFARTKGSATVSLRGNRFEGNRTGPNGYGGALLLWSDGSGSPISAQLASNKFLGNRAGTAASHGFGGAVAVHSYSALADKGSTFSGNRAVGDGAYGGAVYNDSGQSQRFVGTTFTGNAAGGATGYGGAVYSDNSAGDAFTRVTMAGNKAATGGGGFYGDSGAYSVSFESSTVSGNTAGTSANEGTGGGIYFGDALAVLENSTVTGNKAVSGGGKDGAGGGIWSSGSRLGVRYSTVSGNLAAVGGGIYADAYGGTLLSSIVSDNHTKAGGPEQDCLTDSSLSALHSLGGNVLGQADCVTSTQSTDKVTTKPGLGPLKANGGPTKTMALSAKSPAVGRASFLVPGTDQRGKPRPSKHADAGAFELP